MTEEKIKQEVKEEVKEILTKEDLNVFADSLKVVFTNISNRLQQLEQQKQPMQEPQQQSKLDLATLLTLMKAGGGETGEFGTEENKTFFAGVGKSDFDNFRLLQQRRMLRLLEKESKVV